MFMLFVGIFRSKVCQCELERWLIVCYTDFHLTLQVVQFNFCGVLMLLFLLGYLLRLILNLSDGYLACTISHRLVLLKTD